MLRQYRQLEHSELIVVGGDCSEGVNDYSVCQFMSVQNRDVPLVWSDKVIATEMTNEIFFLLEAIYDITKVAPVVAYEMQHGGVFEMQRLFDMNRQGKYQIYRMQVVGTDKAGDSVRYGWNNTSLSRPAMLSQLKADIENRIIKTVDEETIKEMMSFVLVQRGKHWKAQAESGGYDDHVMALGIANQVRLNYQGKLKQEIKKSKMKLMKRLSNELSIPQETSLAERQYLASINRGNNSSHKRGY